MKSLIQIFLLNILFTTALASQEVEYGIASFYSDLFHGKPTASGELYDKGKLTTAHKTLPFGTSLRVTRMDNNKSIVVRVNDRGPFISGRIVELSKEAARQIGLDQEGSARVKVEIVSEKPVQEATASKQEEKPVAYEETQEPVKEAKQAEKKTEKAEKKAEVAAKADDKTSKTLAINEKPAAPAKTTAKGTAEPSKPATPSTAVKVLAKDYQPFDLYQIELKRPLKKGYGVQIAALSTQDALFKKIAELQGDWFDNILVSVEKAGNDVRYKVILGTFASQGEADIYKANLKRNKKIEGFVVDLADWEKDSSK